MTSKSRYLLLPLSFFAFVIGCIVGGGAGDALSNSQDQGSGSGFASVSV